MYSLQIRQCNHRAVDRVFRRCCDALVVELFEVDFNVGEIVLVRIAVPNIECYFRLEILQDRILSTALYHRRVPYILTSGIFGADFTDVTSRSIVNIYCY